MTIFFLLIKVLKNQVSTYVQFHLTRYFIENMFWLSHLYFTLILVSYPVAGSLRLNGVPLFCIFTRNLLFLCLKMMHALSLAATAATAAPHNIQIHTYHFTRTMQTIFTTLSHNINFHALMTYSKMSYLRSEQVLHGLVQMLVVMLTYFLFAICNYSLSFKI